MAQSSDEVIKREILDKVGYEVGNIKLRIFPDSSREDQNLFSEGGLTFGYNGVAYGSCDAVWYIENKKYVSGYNKKRVNDFPVIALEGTDALSRGSSGNAQIQRFHHVLGAVKDNILGIYYLKKGEHEVHPDLYGMAYFASKEEKGNYLIIQDLNIVNDILKIINEEGLESSVLQNYIDDQLNYMYKLWDKKKFKKLYDRNWEKFAKRRSTIIKDNYVLKYAGRCLNNFTKSSQRAGHIAVGEMFLTRYYFYTKNIYYLFSRMTKDDLDYLDNNKNDDKEWYLLRNEPNVSIITSVSYTHLTLPTILRV